MKTTSFARTLAALVLGISILSTLPACSSAQTKSVGMENKAEATQNAAAQKSDQTSEADPYRNIEEHMAHFPLMGRSPAGVH